MFQTSKPEVKVDLLCIDVSWVAKRHEHALGQRFTTSDGRMSGHVYGAYKDFASIISYLNPKQTVFCYDRGYNWRVELVPTYKKSRGAGLGKREDGDSDVERLAKCFPGIHLELPGSEADDMIAWATANLGKEMSSAVYSRDRDLWQLVNDSTRCLMPGTSKGKRVWVDSKYVEAELGVPPSAIAKWKALLGDTSDDIQGLIGGRRPGKKQGLKDFAVHEASTAFFNGDEITELPCVDWLAEALLAERSRLINNFRVTSLPYAVSQLTNPPSEQASTGDLASGAEVLAEFECESLLPQISSLFERLS